MDIKNKCSSKDHLTIEAISYCQKCELFMCKKCDIIHSNLCPHHNKLNLDNNNSNEIFTSICKEKNI